MNGLIRSVSLIIAMFSANLSFGQVYKIDNVAMKQDFIDETSSLMEKLLDQPVKDSVVMSQVDLLFRPYDDLEGYIMIEKDSIEYIVGRDNINCYKLNIEDFFKVAIIKDDTIRSDQFVFVRTDIENEIERIKDLKELYHKNKHHLKETRAKRESILTFEERSISYDTVQKGEIIRLTFKFQNNSDESVSLIRVQNGCECINIYWSDKPIMPGMKDSIVLRFDTQNIDIEETKKIIIVQCDLDDRPIFLEIDGMIVEEKKSITIKRGDGNVLLEKYEVINQWEDSYVWIKAEGKIGLLDNQKNVIIEPFVEGEIIVFTDQILVVHNNKRGLFDLRGNVIVPLVYSTLELYEDFCKYSYIDKEGNTLEGFYDKNWNKMFKQDFCKVRRFYKKNAALSEDCEKSILMNLETMKPLSKDTFTYLKFAGNDRLAASKDNIGFGIINLKGEIVIPFNYESIASIYYQNGHIDSLFLAEKDEKFGVVNLSDETVVNFKYDKIYLKHGVFFCSLKGKWGLVDFYDKIVVPFKYDKIYSTSNGTERYIVSLGGRQGVINTKNEVVLDINYERVRLNDSGYSAAKSNNKWAVFDDDGNMICDFIFDSVRWLGEKFKVSIAGNVFLLDLQLNCIKQCPTEEFLEKYNLGKKD